MTCNSRCWFAKSEPDKCKCSCNGANHGHGNPEIKEDDLIEIILSKEEGLPYYKQMNKRYTCFCGYEGLHNLPIYGYSHPGGWKIRKDKYWLYIKCPSCGHDWAIWKLGVSRGELNQTNLGDF